MDRWLARETVDDKTFDMSEFRNQMACVIGSAIRNLIQYYFENEWRYVAHVVKGER